MLHKIGLNYYNSLEIVITTIIINGVYTAQGIVTSVGQYVDDISQGIVIYVHQYTYYNS
jgi:hypothetical protein